MTLRTAIFTALVLAACGSPIPEKTGHTEQPWTTGSGYFQQTFTFGQTCGSCSFQQYVTNLGGQYILRGQYLCEPQGWSGYMSGSGSANSVRLDWDVSGYYLVSAQIPGPGNYSFRVGCALNTGLNVPMTAWHNANAASAVGGSHTVVTPAQGTGGPTWCNLLGWGGPTTTSSDISELIHNGGSWSIYTQTDSSHGSQTRITRAACEDFSTVSLNGTFTVSAAQRSVYVGCNSLCAPKVIKGGMQSYPSGWYYDPSSCTLNTFSADGVNFPTVTVDCMPIAPVE